MDVLHYVSARGVDVFSKWFDGVVDLRARIAVHERVNRVLAGNLGDHKFCRDGGDKRSQRKDITMAIQLLDDYRARTRIR